MNEHELCCGTVADKQKLCAEIAERDRVIAAQQRRIGELLQERDEALAKQDDSERIEWLEKNYVSVRKPLRYGSKELFTASPSDGFLIECERDTGSELRSYIDIQRAQEPK